MHGMTAQRAQWLGHTAPCSLEFGRFPCLIWQYVSIKITSNTQKYAPTADRSKEDPLSLKSGNIILFPQL